MPRTSRLGWVFPSEEQKSWYRIYQALINQQDVDVYAGYENPHLILRGGGTVNLDTGTDTLSWSDDFEVLSLLTGGVIIIEAGSLVGFEAGKIAYVSVSRPVSGAVVSTLSLADNLGVDNEKLFVAMRRGGAVFFRNHANRDAMSFVDKMGASGVTTSVVASSGGIVTGSIQVGAIEGTIWLLRVGALGDTVDSSIHFYSDAGMTDELYEALNKDCYTSSHEDRVPWYFSSDAAGLVYYSITNDGANDSAYDIEFSGMGRVAS